MPTPFAKPMLAAAILTAVLDQATKRLVLELLPPYTAEWPVIDGFFRFVHWENTAAAWSLFRDNNQTLAVVSVVALIALFFARRHFVDGSRISSVALGMMFGGIVGNLIDRVLIGHVVDFLYFHVTTRTGREAGFPAFNIADAAICIGVGILFMRSWNNEPESAAAESKEKTSDGLSPSEASQE